MIVEVLTAYVDPALVNAILIAIVMSSAHLDVAGWAIVKCPLG
jgi:hypothetical protein